LSLDMQHPCTIPYHWQRTTTQDKNNKATKPLPCRPIYNYLFCVNWIKKIYWIFLTKKKHLSLRIQIQIITDIFMLCFKNYAIWSDLTQKQGLFVLHTLKTKITRRNENVNR
jgi:hypothetical protein